MHEYFISKVVIPSPPFQHIVQLATQTGSLLLRAWRLSRREGARPPMVVSGGCALPSSTIQHCRPLLQVVSPRPVFEELS